MKKKVFIGIGVAVLVIALIVAGVVKNAGSVGSGPVYGVSAAEIKKGDINSYLSANGTVTEVEKNEVYIDTPLKVKKLLINENEHVKKGQQIVDLDFDDLKLQLEQAELQKRTQELALKKYRLIDSTVSVTSAENSLKVAENSVTSAQRSYDAAVKNLNDSKALFEADAISKSELDNAGTAVKDAEAALNNAKLNLESQKESIKSTTKSNTQSANSKQIDIETQEIAIETTALNIKDLENKIKKYTNAMYSTMDGIVTRLAVSEGSFTPTGTPAFTVVNPDKLEVKLNINEYNAKQMKPGQKVDITGDSIPDSDKVTGVVKSVSPVANKNMTNSGSEETVIEVRVALDSITPAIKPGITVNCDIKTVEMTNILTLELDMLSPDKDGNNFVYVLSEDKKTMHKKPVQLGTTSDMKAELKSGDIKEGDFVVMNPKTTFKDGARVKLGEN